MQCRLLLNVVITQSAPILELFSSKDQALLIRWNALLILDLALYIVNGIARLDFKSDGLSGEGLDEDLHSAA